MTKRHGFEVARGGALIGVLAALTACSSPPTGGQNDQNQKESTLQRAPEGHPLPPHCSAWLRPFLFPPHAKAAVLMHLAVSADGTRAMSGDSDGELRLWNLATGSHEVLRSSGGPVTRVALSGDGSVAAAAQGDRFAVWETKTKRLRCSFDLHCGSQGWGNTALAISPDGSTVAASGTCSHLHLFDGGTGKPLGVRLDHEWSVSSAFFTPDGESLISAEASPPRGIRPGEDAESRINCWKVSSRERTWASIFSGGEPGLAVSRNGKYVAAGSWPGQQLVWNPWIVILEASSGDLVARCPVLGASHSGNGGGSLAFTSSGDRLLALSSEELRVWSVPGGVELPKPFPTLGGGNPMPGGDGLLALPGGTNVILGERGALRWVNLETGLERFVLERPGQAPTLTFVIPSSCGSWSTPLWGPEALLREVREPGHHLLEKPGKAIWEGDRFTSPRGQIQSHDQSLSVEVGADETLEVRSVATNALLLSVRPHPIIHAPGSDVAIGRIAFSLDDHKLLSVGVYGDVRIWEIPKDASGTLGLIRETLEKADSLSFTIDETIRSGNVSRFVVTAKTKVQIKNGTRIRIEGTVEHGNTAESYAVVSDGNILKSDFPTNTVRDDLPEKTPRNILPYLIEQLLFRGPSYYDGCFGDIRYRFGVVGVEAGKDETGPYLTYTTASTKYIRSAFDYLEEGASVKLWFDPKTHLPLKRQFVRVLADEDVRVARRNLEVTETFKDMTLNADLPDEIFKRDGKR